MGKLVRDGIPAIIEASGKKPTVRVADEKEYELMLLEKLREETEEFIEARNEEELADILEVLRALCERYGFSLEDIERKREEKAEERGGFSERIVLERTD